MPSHHHDWPADADGWSSVATCHACGLASLGLFVRSSDWVVRRVEKVEFLDHRTVRRKMSVDYVSPRAATRLRRGDDTEVRVVPLTIMRKRTLTNFDLRDADGRALSLLGLRETQALTCGVLRAWAAAALAPRDPANRLHPVDDAVRAVVDDIVAGDQAEITRARRTLSDAAASRPTSPLGVLGGDDVFMGLVERLAGSFLLLTLDDGPEDARRIVKFAYDEALTLQYTASGYRGYATPAAAGGEDGQPPRPTPPTYGPRSDTPVLSPDDTRRAARGLEPTLIRFPVPAAELAASFHFEVKAPPEVSIVQASLLAGLPNLYRSPSHDPAEDKERWAAQPRGSRLRRRPSFDLVGGGQPTVDLHAADVPFGSLSRAQVLLQADTQGWLAMALAATVLATLTLAAALIANPGDGENGITVLVSFAAGVAALLARNDSHGLVSHLLSWVRNVATASAVLTLLGATALATLGPRAEGWALGVLLFLSLLATFAVGRSWVSARVALAHDWQPESMTRIDYVIRRKRFGHGERTPARRGAAVAEIVKDVATNRPGPISKSPWEQDGDPDLGREPWHVERARMLEEADYPYDRAVELLAFHKAAIEVVSAEAERRHFTWNEDFKARFDRRLEGASRRAARRPSATRASRRPYAAPEPPPDGAATGT